MAKRLVSGTVVDPPAAPVPTPPTPPAGDPSYSLPIGSIHPWMRGHVVKPKPTPTCTFVEGDLFGMHWQRCDALLVTTNSCKRKSDGGIVMGKGAAKELSDLCPGIAVEFGSHIEHMRKYGVVWAGKRYGLVTMGGEDGDEILWEVPLLGAFQVKYSWEDDANIALITYSCVQLAKWCKANPGKEVRLNFPGIGNGRLKRKDVEPVLVDLLPRQVMVCYKREE